MNFGPDEPCQTCGGRGVYWHGPHPDAAQSFDRCPDCNPVTDPHEGLRSWNW